MTQEFSAEYMLFHQAIPVMVPKPYAYRTGVSALGRPHMRNEKNMALSETAAVEHELRFGIQLAEIISEGGHFYFQDPAKDAPLLYQWLHETLKRFTARKRSGLHSKDIPLDEIEKLDALAHYVYERAKSHIKLGPLESGGSARTARFFANRNFEKFRKHDTVKQEEAKARAESTHVSVMDDLHDLVASRNFTGNRRFD